MSQVATALGVDLGSFDGSRRLYDLEAEGSIASAAQSLLVEAWRMREQLDAVPVLEVYCLSTDPMVDRAAFLQQPVRLRTTLADGGTSYRSGTVWRMDRLSCDAGLARYRLCISPWAWMLGQRRHSGLWQQRTVVEVLDDHLDALRAVGAWRWSPEVADFIAQGNGGGVRTSVAQYREDDLSFAARLLAEEGIGWRFEELDDPSLPTGLVFFTDSTQAPEDPSSAGAPAGLRYHRASSVEESDTVQVWAAAWQGISTATTLKSWNPDSRSSVAATVVTTDLPDGYPRAEDFTALADGLLSDNGAALHYALIRRQHEETKRLRYVGRGTVRTLRAGTRVRIDGLPGTAAADPQGYLLLRVHSVGVNNLPAEFDAALFERYGTAGVDLIPHDDAWTDDELIAQAKAHGFANSFEALPASRPWRSAQLPKPVPPDYQSATVVGPDGEAGGQEIYCDANGRVRVRFHWQRGLRPDDRNTAWLRVGQAMAGAGAGTRFVPRVGQEVLVAFLGDIDACYVRCALYNGRGEAGLPATPGGEAADPDTSALAGSSDHRPSGQGNTAGGNSPAWHGAAAGAADPQAEAQNNAAALSGIKTQEFGGTGFNQLVFDDTDQQLRVQMGTTQHQTWLQMGHLVHQADNHRGSFRGLGFELRTDAWGAVRAQQGLLLSSYGTDPEDPAGDNAAVALAQQMAQLAQTFDGAAKTHETVRLATQIGSLQPGHSALSDQAAPLPALATALNGMVSPDALDEAKEDAAKTNIATAGKVPHTAAPVLAVAARGGLVATAGEDLVVAAEDTIHLGAGQDLGFTSGGTARLHTLQAIGVLGGAVQPGGEASGTGVSLIAGQGDVQVQAQSAALQLAAQGMVDVRSASGNIDWTSAKKITLRTAQGASVVISSDGIDFTCPGQITVKAATKSFEAAAQDNKPLPMLPHADLTDTPPNFKLCLADMPGTHGRPLPDRPWSVVTLKGPGLPPVDPDNWRDTLCSGTTDGSGECTLSDDQKLAVWQAVSQYPGKVFLVSGPNATPITFNRFAESEDEQTRTRTLDAHNYAVSQLHMDPVQKQMLVHWAEKDYDTSITATPTQETQA